MAPKQRMRLANDAYSKNVSARGNVAKSLVKTEEGKSPAAPWLIGLFVFVVCGSAVFEIIRYVKMGWWTLVTGRRALSNRNSRKCDSLCVTRIFSSSCAVCKPCCCWLLCFCYFVCSTKVCVELGVCAANMKWLSTFCYAFLSLDQFSRFECYTSLYNLDHRFCSPKLLHIQIVCL